MKILPITTNNNKPVVSKGCVSAQVEDMIKEMACSCRENVQYHSLFNRDIASNYLKYAEAAENVLYNLETIMLQYSKGSVLRAKQSAKYPQNLRFYISENASYYKRIIGDFYKDKNDSVGNIKRLVEFTDKLTKENPYETNLKFRMNTRPEYNKADFFAPEKESIIIEDELKEYNLP